MTAAMTHYANKRKYFFLPVNTGYVTNGLPNDHCVDFYAARSGHGIYCAIVGNVVIPGGFHSNCVCAEISDSKVWQRLTEGITAQGARAGIQLSTTWKNYVGIKQFTPNTAYNPISEYKSAIVNISFEDVLQIFKNFRRGIELSIRAGFNHIQIHAAHGYLFSLLIEETFSQYSELALDNLQMIAEKLESEDIESSLRFSLITGDASLDQNRSKLIEKIVALPFSFFDISFGFYNINKHLIYPTTKEALELRLKLTLALAKKIPDKQIILSGKSNGAWDPALPPNVHIGICRDLIANPNFLHDRAFGCTNCLKCHYYSNNEMQLSCEKWVLDA